MQSTTTPKIEFRKQRDFGQLFTDVFKFLKLNFKTIFLCVLIIPGPLFLIAGCYYGYLQSLGNDPSRLMGVGFLRDPFSVFTQIIGAMLPYFVLLVIGSLALSATVNRYLILYQEREQNNSIGINDIVKYLPSDMWRLFYNGLLFGVLFFLFMIPIAFIAIIPFFGAFVIIIAMLLAGPQIGYTIAAANYLVLRDKILITVAFQKAWGYMKPNFWWTWLIVVCSALMVGIMGAIFNIPMMVVSMMNNFSRFNQSPTDSSSVLYIVLGAIAILGPKLLTPITSLFYVLTYHSHEETKEGAALSEKINQIK